MRTLGFLFALCLVFLQPGTGKAHEIRPAVIDYRTVGQDLVLELRLNAEAILAGIDLSQSSRSDTHDNSEQYADLRQLDPGQVEDRFRQSWTALQGQVRIRADGADLLPSLVSVDVASAPSEDVARDSMVILRAPLPADAREFAIRWSSAYGPFVLREADGGPDGYAAFVLPGAESPPVAIGQPGGMSAMATIANYVPVGFVHILPKGLDHILFVIGLFLYSPRLRPLVVQVTAFTVAHSVTLALATTGLVTAPPSVVEPLIAASIALVVLENLFRRSDRVGPARTSLIFGFGLLHGLGFAGVLSEIGFPEGRLVPGLLGFNIGVELGQLAVLAGAWVLVELPFRSRPWIRGQLVTTLCLSILGLSLYWTVERAFS